METLNRDEYYSKSLDIFSIILDMCSNSSISTDKSTQSGKELYKRAVKRLYNAYNNERYDNILYSNSNTAFASEVLRICTRARWNALKILAAMEGPKYYEPIKSYDDQIYSIFTELNMKWRDAVIQEFRAKYGKEE